jgi:hypothetical protein
MRGMSYPMPFAASKPPRISGAARVVGALAILLALALTSSGVARAQEGESPPAVGGGFHGASVGFAQPGQWVFSMVVPDEFPLMLTKTGSSPWSVTVRPSADYFLSYDVSVGGLVSFHDDGGGTDVGLGARAGYNIMLPRSVSIWMRGGMYVHRASPDNAPAVSETILNLEVPFLFHFVQHFFLGLGPRLSVPIYRSDDASTDSTIGVTAIVGGYY